MPNWNTIFLPNNKKLASGQNKVRADIFSGSLAVCLFASASGRGGRKGGLGGIPPAEPVNEICSDIFKYIPPVGKRSVWLARYAGSPADFEAEIEFFAFVPQGGTPEAGFPEI